MKKFYAALFISLIAGATFGQTINFEQVGQLGQPNLPDFDGVKGGSIAFSDIDGDGDQDVLITGSHYSAKLYTNDGSGNFTVVTGTPFDGVEYGSIAFSDIDGDGDQDVLITGSYYSAKLYTNDGSGNFSLVAGTPFDGVDWSSIAFSDIDGDGDQDVLITGRNSSSQPIAKLYTNDGSGNFTLVVGTPFVGVHQSSIAFSDIDGDSDQDVLITGYNSSSQPIAKLYTNDGNGNFSLVAGTPFDGVRNSSIAFSDIDGDADQDVLITGSYSSGHEIAKLYTNDGSGNFTLVAGTPFDGVSGGSIAFSDIDGDSDQDVLITGKISSGQRIAKLYTNDGSGNFTLVAGTPFHGVNSSSIAFSDIDGDGDEDVLITGETYQLIAKLYTNDGSGNFTWVAGTPFDGVYYSSIAFSDIDGDSDQDVLITGLNSLGQRIAKLYTNDGSGNFTLLTGTPFDGVDLGSIAFSDIDGDGDQDVLITGRNSLGQRIAKLYTNDGSGNFSLVAGTPFDGVFYSSIAFSDIDGDGDQDVLITGGNISWQSIAKLYTNDGSGNFSLVAGTPFEGVYNSSIAFSDIDGDGDQDVLITGSNSSYQKIAKLYTNDGSGNFSLVTGTPFDGVRNSSIAFSDIDGDGDEDVLITGENSSYQEIAKLYTNDGSGNFSLVTGTPFDGVRNSSIAFSDIDGDSDQDVLITGENISSQQIAKLYTNDGSGNFTLVADTPFDGVRNSSITFSDIDGDGDQDVLITGLNSSNQRIAKLYKNIACFTTSTINLTECDSLVSPSGNYTWTTSGTYMDTIANACGSDNVITVNLTINNSIINNASAVVECDSAQINGNWYNTSQTVTDLFSGGAANGCDSTVITQLTINNSVINNATAIVACDSAQINGNWYNTSQTVTDLFSGGAANGCDSTVITPLTIYNSVTNNASAVVECDSAQINGNWYYTSQTVTDLFSSGAANGCDSTVITPLTINNSVTNNASAVIACDSAQINGNWYYTSQTVTDLFSGGSSNGCDSTVITPLTISNCLMGEWYTVGNAGFSAGPAYHTNIAIDGSGTPYVAYADFSNGWRAIVKKFNGTAWVTVGNAGFSAGSTTYTSIAIDGSGTPYVAYMEEVNSDYKVTVMKFNGTSWVTVGNAGFSATSVWYTSIAIDSSGTPYVAYRDGNSNSNKATVMKFNGTNWIAVGNAGFSAGESHFPSIAIDGSGIPYVAYSDEGSNSGKATVMKFNGTSWTTVGTAGFSAGRASYTSIAIDGSGTPYVVYKDYGNSDKATVMKFNGTTWITVGNAGFSATSVWYTSIAIDSSGTPYVAYRYGNSNSNKATVKKFNGTNWIAVGTVGFSAGGAEFTNIAIDGSGTPYVAYMDGGNSGKATVMSINICPQTTSTINPTECDSLVSPSGNYIWTTSGTYMDTIPNACGSDNVITVNLTINQSPIADAGVNDTIQNGTSTTLTGLGTGGEPPYTFLWNNSSTLSDPSIYNPQATPDFTTTYMLTITDDIGCFDNDSVEIVVTNIPANYTVIIDTIFDGQEECFNAISVLTVADSENEVVILPGGEVTFIAGQKILFKPGFHSNSGSITHAYITTTADYCSSLPPLISTPDIVAGEHLIDPELYIVDEANINIYPNPTTGHFTIDFKGEETTADILLLNFQGRTLMENKCKDQMKIDLDIAYLPTGIYILIIKTKTELITKKIIKNY